MLNTDLSGLDFLNMDWFAFAVIVGFALLTWVTAGAAWGLVQLRLLFRADGGFASHVRRKIEKGATIPDAVDMARKWRTQPGALEPLWLELEVGLAVTEPCLNRIESDVIGIPVQRALSLASIAPACGLLGTAGGIAIGLLSAPDNPTAAAEGLIAALPVALLSTFGALALAIVLRVLVAGTLMHWAVLRQQTLSLNDARPLLPRATARSPHMRPVPEAAS